MPHNKNHTRLEAKEKLKNGLTFGGRPVPYIRLPNEDGVMIELDKPKLTLTDQEAEHYLQYQDKEFDMTWKEDK